MFQVKYLYRRTLHLFILLNLLTSIVLAQSEEDTTNFSVVKTRQNIDSADTYIFYLNKYGAYSLKKLDYPIYQYNQNTVFNPQVQSFVSLGNRGQAGYSLIFSPETSTDIILRPDVFKPFRFVFDSIQFIRCEKPYSEVSYVLGKAKEQRLDFSFSQKLGKNLHFGLRTRFGNAPGAYLHQRSYWAGAYFNLQYISTNNKYNAILSYLTDRFTNYENGGIKYDSVFEQNIETNRKTILVNLNNAMNRDKAHGITFQHSFKLLKLKERSDSSLTARKNPENPFRLVHTFTYYRNTELYSDEDGNNKFYPAIYYDSTSTYDSISRYFIRNTFALTNLLPDTAHAMRIFQYAAGIEHNYDKIYSLAADSVSRSNKYSGVRLFGTLVLNLRKAGTLHTDASLNQNGYNNNDFQFKSIYSNSFSFKKIRFGFKGGLLQALRTPELIFTRFNSNHFIADTSLKKIFSQSIFADINLNGFYISLKNHTLNNYTYLGENLDVLQYPNLLNVIGISVGKSLKMKHFNSQIGVEYQNTNRPEILALPKMLARGSFAYTTWLFKKALQMETGISLFYYTEYNADAYSPAIRMFYRQMEKKAGNHIYADAFANFKIKRMRLFVNYKHFNSAFSGYNYMMVPHYPQADAGVEFGLNWIFFD